VRTYITPEKFTQEEKCKIEFLVEKIIIEKNQLVTVAEIAKYVAHNSQLDISQYYIKKLLLRWNWTFKKPIRMNKRKFTRKNIQRYIEFVSWVQTIPLNRLKFLDESHFEVRSTYF